MITQELSKQDEMIIQYFEDGNTIDDKGICYDNQGKQLKVYNITATCDYIILYYKGVNLRVHRLQAFRKYNYDMFKGGIIVRHLNDIGNDNRFSNIAIGTTKDNLTDIRRIGGVSQEYQNDLIERMLEGQIIVLQNELQKLKFYYGSTHSILGLLRILLNDNPQLNGCHYRYSQTSKVLKLGHLDNRRLIRQQIRALIRNQILNSLPINVDELHSQYGNFYKNTNYYKQLIKQVREQIEQQMCQQMCQ